MIFIIVTMTNLLQSSCIMLNKILSSEFCAIYACILFLHVFTNVYYDFSNVVLLTISFSSNYVVMSYSEAFYRYVIVHSLIIIELNGCIHKR